MIPVLALLTCLLVVALIATGVMLAKASRRNAALIKQVSSVTIAAEEQLTKCKEGHVELKKRAEDETKKLYGTIGELKAQNQRLGKYEQGYRDLKAKAEEKIRGLMAAVADLQGKNQTAQQNLTAQIAKMQRWQGIIDAEEEARRIISEAQAEAEQLRADAQRILAEAQAKAQSLIRECEERLAEAVATAQKITSEANTSATDIRQHVELQAADMLAAARDEARHMTDHAKSVMEEARARANQLVADAEEEAKNIAGEAYELKKNLSLYERTLKAVKNQLEGYGDEYIVPTHSLLDDLADEFSHAEAGKELKAARDRVKAMIKNDEAAACDYVEANRRLTAVRFVVDAFNGKVDSILSTAKHDNFGKLSQQIKDAFLIVNSNGEAFRSARITDRYLAARLEELKWAVIAHELKKKEQEEQRLIKERMREEEKARREYERAIKEAAREEEAVQKAMAKLQEQLGKASAEERAKYEAQLQEMQEKLRAAEERGQRALSMAQQTKAGHVYIISNVGSFGEHVYKIGLTRRLDPLDRVRELGDSSVPFEFDVHALIKADDAPALENQLHKHFLLHQVNKVNYRKEFFRCDLSTIRAEVEKLGLQTHWTMLAEAADYRETLAIEKKLADDPLARERWMQRQLELDPTDGGRGELIGVGAGSDQEDDEM
jgi:hypothetical protein